MIFQSLHQLYERLADDPDYEIAAPGKSYQKTTFVVVLDRHGELVDIQDARQPAAGKLLPRRTLVLGDTKPSGSGLNPCFLWDNTGYMLGYDPARPERALSAFEEFRKKHLEAEKEIDLPEFSAVCRFLESWEPARAVEFPILEQVRTGFGVFQIRGETNFVHENPRISSWWERRSADRATGPPRQCLVTGKVGPIARTHPKLKGVADAQPSGATIAGFNDSAYWSYGFEQSYNSPVSEEAARRYTSALNSMLDGPKRQKHRLVVGGTTVVFWTEKPTFTEDIFAAFAAEGSAAVATDAVEDETVRAKIESFLKALRSGLEAYGEIEETPEQTRYFILGLAAPTPARVSVRFFHQGTLAELLCNLRRHLSDIGVERRFGSDSQRPDPEFPPAWLLLRETVPRGGDIAALLPPRLLESIVTGTQYPEAIYAAVMRRIMADGIVNYARACLIKGCLVRNRGKEVSMSLDTRRADPAYRLGRLFAALEKTQQDALGGGVGATIRDRFYASASSTPATVFPRLLRTYQHHLGKLEGGRKVNREKLVEEILDPLADMPAHLGLPDQGLFALGYYHQMNAFYRKKEDAEETMQE